MSRLTIVGLLALALCAVACTSKVTIGEIQNDAPTYDGKSVTLSGEVTSRLSLIFWKTYNLSDGTGEITVVTKKACPTWARKWRSPAASKKVSRWVRSRVSCSSTSRPKMIS